MLPTSKLDSHLQRLSKLVGRAKTVSIQHPAELRTFKDLNPNELSAAAARHDLRIVSRVGGRQLEFTRLAKA